ncbi:hypothetical protein ACJX0J_039608, partial [Zea mays]
NHILTTTRMDRFQTIGLHLNIDYLYWIQQHIDMFALQNVEIKALLTRAAVHAANSKIPSWLDSVPVY